MFFIRPRLSPVAPKIRPVHRYAVQQRQQEQQQQQTPIGFDGVFQQQRQQQQFQRGGRKFTDADEPRQNFDTSGRFAAARSDPSQQPSSPSPQQGPLTLSNNNVRQLLQQLDVAGSQQCNLNVQAQWDFETNVNEATQIRAVSRRLQGDWGVG